VLDAEQSKPAPDAIHVDTEHLNLGEVIHYILEQIHLKRRDVVQPVHITHE
jgi:cytidylate kinase